jgi:hypothetical protein
MQPSESGRIWNDGDHHRFSSYARQFTTIWANDRPDLTAMLVGLESFDLSG